MGNRRSRANWLLVCPAVLAISAMSGCPLCIDDGSGGSPTSAMVKGFVFQTDTLVIVDCPVNATSGASPVGGVEVRISDIEGSVVATATTDASGRFQIEDLPSGLLTIDVFTDPVATGPDATVSATGYPGARIDLGKSYPTSRDAATQLVLSKTRPGALVMGSLQPLAAGTEIGELFSVNGPVRQLEADEWFYFVDLRPSALYAHAVEFVSVDAWTGQMTRIDWVTSPPSVNGGLLWDNDQELFRYEGFDPETLHPYNIPADATAIPSPEVVQFDLERQSAPVKPSDAPIKWANILKHNTDPGSVFVLIVQGGLEFWANVLKMKAFFADAKVPYDNVKTVQSHLWDPPTAGPLPKDYNTKLKSINDKIQERLDRGEHSTLIVYITAHATVVFEEPSQKFPNGRNIGLFGMIWKGENLREASLVSASDLKLTSTKACKVRVIIDACFSEQLGQDLRKEFSYTEHDLKICCSSCLAEPSYRIPDWYLFRFLDDGTPVAYAAEPGSIFTSALLGTMAIENGDLANIEGTDSTSYHPDILTKLKSLDAVLKEVDNKPNSPYQDPKIFPRPSDPSWCTDSGVSDHPPETEVILAESSPPTTIYTIVASDPDGDALTFTWWTPSCGDIEAVFEDENYSIVSWSHPDPPCADATTNDELVTVTISDGTWEVVCSYVGTACGTGPPCSRRSLILTGKQE